jgi:hypothetical protein
MDFTELFKQTGQLCLHQPPPQPANGSGSQFIAVAVQHRLVLRDAHSLQLAAVYACPSTIHRLSWSPDGRFILCAGLSTPIPSNSSGQSIAISGSMSGGGGGGWVWVFRADGSVSISSGILKSSTGTFYVYHVYVYI